MVQSTNDERSATLKVIENAPILGELKQALSTYCKQEFCVEGIKELRSRVEDLKNNEDQLKKDFMEGRIQFGTAGLRAKMAYGPKYMNELTVLQTSQGIAEYLLNRKGGKGQGKVYIGYDGRHNSRKYAEYAAVAFVVKGFETYLFSYLTPTPYTPFAVKQYGGEFGIQVTASHNPKEDNGYKVYDSNGAQIVPPIDDQIANTILKTLNTDESLSMLPKLMSQSNLKTEGVLESIEGDYMKVMSAAVLRPVCEKSDLKIVYTAMHGVGSKGVHSFVKLAGFNMDNFYKTPLQDEPDPEFSTVVFPNPEEEGALNLAQAEADRVGARVVFANDPDADRFALCEKQPDGSWYRFHGNEIGQMLGHICMESAVEKGTPYKDQLFVSTAVSSQMLKAIVEAKGCKYIDTLTGFKWIMNGAIQQIEKEPNLTFIMGYEEALGYATSMKVPDKDGVTAAGIFAQSASSLYKRNTSFKNYLLELRKEHGTFIANNGYVKCHMPPMIKQMFTALRNDGKYVNEMDGSKVVRVRDVTTGYDNGMPDKKCVFPRISSEMITFYLENGSVITLRTSGTEPKIKWYSEMVTDSVEKAEQSLKRLVHWVIRNVFHPELYTLDALPEDYKQ